MLGRRPVKNVIASGWYHVSDVNFDMTCQAKVVERRYRRRNRIQPTVSVTATERD